LIKEKTNQGLFIFSEKEFAVKAVNFSSPFFLEKFTEMS